MRWRALGIMTIACVLALTLAATPAAAFWTEWMSFTRIGWDSLFDAIPDSYAAADVQGDWVVWERTLDSAVDWNVEAYNIKTRAIKSVSAATGNQQMPRVDGDWVVYEDGRWGNLEIYAYNLTTGAEKRLTNRAGDQEAPDISGTKVVYMDPVLGDLYLYDLASDVETTLPLGAGVQTNGRISGHRVVYVESNDIFVYDTAAGTTTRLTNDAVADGVPDIDGTLVAWQRVGAGVDVWTQQLVGGLAMPAVSTAGNEGAPRVSGSKVVFYQFTGGQWDVGVYDKLVGDWQIITSAPTADVYPAIDGSNIVYTADNGVAGAHGGDIALGVLIAPELSAKAASSVISYGATTTISGSLVENGIPLGSLPMAIDQSVDGGNTWTQVATFNTDAAGGYVFTTPALITKATYRARYNGSLYFVSTTEHFSALSSVVTVTPKASVGKPTGYPSTGKKTKSYSVHGSLKPRQVTSAAAAKVAVIKCYRKQHGKYVLRKTVSAKVYDYSTYSRYSAKVKLPYSGKWRMRAYFAGSLINAAKYSAYRYVRVK